MTDFTTISTEEFNTLLNMRNELHEFRMTKALILSTLADCKRYGSKLDTEWVEMMLRDVEPRS